MFEKEKKQFRASGKALNKKINDNEKLSLFKKQSQQIIGYPEKVVRNLAGRGISRLLKFIGLDEISIG